MFLCVLEKKFENIQFGQDVNHELNVAGEENKRTISLPL